MFSIVHTTTKDKEEAKRIASKLVEQKLAACVNMNPIDSVYIWKGKVESEREIALSVKTTSSKVDSVIECIKNMHSYELPAITSWNISGDEEYLKWIAENVDKS